jgi:hypothetical protein
MEACNHTVMQKVVDNKEGLRVCGMLAPLYKQVHCAGKHHPDDLSDIYKKISKIRRDNWSIIETMDLRALRENAVHNLHCVDVVTEGETQLVSNQKRDGPSFKSVGGRRVAPYDGPPRGPPSLSSLEQKNRKAIQQYYERQQQRYKN